VTPAELDEATVAAKGRSLRRFDLFHLDQEFDHPQHEFFPMMGKYVPRGWKLTEVLHCARSDAKSPQLLTYKQLRENVRERERQRPVGYPRHGYGVVDMDLLSIFVGVFTTNTALRLLNASKKGVVTARGPNDRKCAGCDEYFPLKKLRVLEAGKDAALCCFSCVSRCHSLAEIAAGGKSHPLNILNIRRDMPIETRSRTVLGGVDALTLINSTLQKGRKKGASQ
jgi:hypothetical protein